MDATHAEDSARFEYRIPASPSSLSALRRRFGSWLGTTPVRDAFASDLILAASELCAAALRVVGPAETPREVLMRSWLDDAALVIEVTDAATDGRAGIEGLQAGDSSRGLSIVATLTDVLTVRAVEGGMLLRARKEQAAGGPAGFGSPPRG